MGARVYVAGRMRIESAGRLIDEPAFPPRQGRVLFAYLVCCPQRPVTRNELADVLWPGTLWIDREAAAEAIDQAEGLVHAGRWQDAWGPANIAAITARLPFLAGEEGDWIEHERARLHTILLRSVDCLCH